MRPELPSRVLCLVTDRSLTGGPDGLAEAVALAVAGGMNMVQLREKDLSPDRLVALARALRGVASGGALLIVNGDPSAALASDADGVQLAEQGMSVADARRVLGSRPLIGRSVHGLEGALQAGRDGVDFLVLGAVFPSRSHPVGPAIGPRGVTVVAEAVELPVIGIGGIDKKNAAQVVRAGARGVAVISAILAAQDPTVAARELASAIGLSAPE